MDPTTVLKFELTIEEANQILVALQEVPAKICNPLSAKLQTQAREQLVPNSDEHTGASLEVVK